MPNKSLFLNYIDEQNIRVINFNEFVNVSKVGKSGKVKKANSTTFGIIALKRLNLGSNLDENDYRDLSIKIKHLCDIKPHPNINQIYGFTKDPNDERCYLVLQYANEGNLREYLKKKFKLLKWNDKLRIAKEIAQGIKYLHENNIIHKDLNSKHILINNGEMMLSDFGISKLLSQAEISTNIMDQGLPALPAYIDPKYLNDQSYIRNEKSDIYSLGVILWEISSGYPPFQSLRYRDTIISHISKGNREIPIKNTPKQYVDLYCHCWNADPIMRPELPEIFHVLNELIIENSNKGASLSDSENYPTFNHYPFERSTSLPDDFIDLDSYIIEPEHLVYISSWIDNHQKNIFFRLIQHKKRFYSVKKIPYDFKLLIRGTQDGFLAKTFHEKCDGKGPTLTIIKVKDTDEILGGYNPISWTESIEHIHSLNSFIFKLDYDKPSNSILSRAKPKESSVESDRNC
ncbi:kinase-like domain-containing protein [Gigaspora rosea]|uniref:Kinase-like domain-containing protein n=1 Tax=Gigaspora rosea TaxID=44941 RepID=A0A397VGF4_9GLOM|nr:kinase-like domain-containing protein [Gigaspora rosea]